MRALISYYGVLLPLCNWVNIKSINRDMRLLVRCFNMGKNIWSSKYELKYWLYILLCKWKEKEFQELKKEWSVWELSPRKGTKKNFWRQELVSGLILSLSHHVFFKKSSCTLQLHFNKHPKLLQFLHVTCWSPAQTFIKWKKTYRKQEKQERLNRQDILPSNSSSFWSVKLAWC